MKAKKKHWMITGLVTCIFLLAIGGCKKDNSANLIPVATLLQHTDCKLFQNNTASSGPSFAPGPADDCIHYQYNGTDTLTFTHINAAFNCCPEEITAAIDIDGNQIIINEQEKKASCHCLCLYDLDYKIENLSPGCYSFRIIEPYIDSNDQILEFTLDLNETTNGDFCLPRNRYPWQ